MTAEFSQATAELRATSLTDVLHRNGIAFRREGISFRAKNERHNVVVTGGLWFDNKAGVGGAGAIDLQMHLTGQDFLAARESLANPISAPTETRGIESLNGTVNGADRTAQVPFHELMAKYARRDDSKWPIARSYLIDERRIDAAIVDELHEVGSIYANDHHPKPSLVFLHRTEHGKVVGASLRDTRHDSMFRPCLGNKRTAWFGIGDMREADSVVAVESPIDALSYYCLDTGCADRLAVVSCCGSAVPSKLMFDAYERRQNFVVGFDNDHAGERGWQQAWDGTADWTGFKITSACPRLKDWNADLIDQRDSQTQRQAPKQSRLHA